MFSLNFTYCHLIWLNCFSLPFNTDDIFFHLHFKIVVWKDYFRSNIVFWMNIFFYLHYSIALQPNKDQVLVAFYNSTPHNWTMDTSPNSVYIYILNTIDFNIGTDFKVGMVYAMFYLPSKKITSTRNKIGLLFLKHENYSVLFL